MASVVVMPAKGSMAAFHAEPVRLLQRHEKMKSRFERLQALNDSTFLGVERPPEGVLRHAYLNYDVFVKEWSGELTGFAIATLREDNQPYLWQFAVDKRFRGLGVGAHFLRTLNSHYTNEGKTSISLTCKIDNPAQTLYFRNGYAVTGVAKNFYGEEGDGLMMRVPLSRPQSVA